MADRTQRIEWTTESGKAASVVVSLERRTRRTGTSEWTGQALTRDEGWVIATAGDVEGMEHREWTNLTRRSPFPGYAGVIGKLAIPDAQMAEIEAAIAALKDTPEWQEQEAARAAHKAEMAGLEESRRQIERAMEGR